MDHRFQANYFGFIQLDFSAGKLTFPFVFADEQFLITIFISRRQMLSFVTTECKHILAALECNLAMTTFHIFQMVMDEAIESNADDYQKFLMSWIQAAAIYSVVWGIGGILDEHSIDAFDRFHRKVSGMSHAINTEFQ